MATQKKIKYFLIRHARAKRTEPDKDRDLDEVGFEQVNQLSEVLLRHECGAGVVIMSEALRAEMTAAITWLVSAKWPRVQISSLYTRDPRIIELITEAKGAPREFLKMDAEGDGVIMDYASNATGEIKKIAETMGFDAVFVFGHGETLNAIGLLLCGDPDNELLNTVFPGYAEGFVIEGTEVRELKRSN